MKISIAILKDLDACESGFKRFKKSHGSNEIMFSECVKSESNTIQDYFWFIRKQSLNDNHKKDLRLLVIEFAERVLPVFEKRRPSDKRPRVAIETAKLYLSGGSTIGALKGARRDAADAAHAAADAAAYVAAYVADAAAYVADAAHAAHAAAHAAHAAAHAAHAAHEISWQKQRLYELMVKWGW